MNLDDALQTFIVESRELLEGMESALLRIEQTPDDVELINAIFRTAHTIKGSAGLFGLDYIVSFTHVAESVLDRVRNGELVIGSELAALLLSCGDHMLALVNHSVTGDEVSAALTEESQTLIGFLSAYLADNNAKPASAPASVMTSVAGINARTISMPSNSDGSFTTEGGGELGTDLWHLSLRFGRDVFKDGMDPLSFIRYLGTLGEIKRIVTLIDGIPAAADMDPECCYLGFEISFKSDADKATIESVFDFLDDSSNIRILPPHSKVSEYLHLIAEMPEEDLRVGEMLLRCGTLTQAELDAVLKYQRCEGSGPMHPIGEVLVEARIVQPAVVEAVLKKQKQVKDNKAAEANLIRVDADKLDELINMVGELIIAGASASLIAKNAGETELQEANATVSRLVEKVRDSALTLRMVQIGATFSRFQRVVRDVSKELGKDIRLVISGEETELDKTVVEKIGDPLTHLMRNSMDHGIESAEVRLARGKPAHGTVRLNAYHDAGSIMIEVGDDGGGLSKDKILAKAIERGLVKEDQPLTDSEIYNLIFEAGLSTVDAVSNLSGRGVGMDVVRRNIQALRGSVDIHSEPGVGTTMRIRLPLTLAIIDGFLVGVDNASYVIPLDMVVECIELTQQDREAAQANDRNYLNLRGEVLPYLRLRDLFEVEGLAPRRENVVVVQYEGHKAGLVVDNLLGEFQTVIKPLGKMFSQVKGVGGFTILGSGDVALIMDVPRLMQQAAGGEHDVLAA